MDLLSKKRRNQEFQMLGEIEISNFKCFEHLKIDEVRRINVLVGDNGSGKTALMEAIFLALGAETKLVERYRQQRGLESGAMAGAPADIEETYFGDLFFNSDLSRSVKVSLNGTGDDRRTLTIVRGVPEKAIRYFRQYNPNFVPPPGAFGPFTFSWADKGNEERFVISRFVPGAGIQWSGTGEVLPTFFYFPANQQLMPTETSTRYSHLSKFFKEAEFKQKLVHEFKIISDISIELISGMGILHGTVPGLRQKVPIPSVSGAINRITGVLLCMAATPGCLVLIDEMENGIYYSHQSAVWKAVLQFARDQQCQIITTTHSVEWLRSLVRAAESNVSDIALWRLEFDSKSRPELFRFDGETLKDGIEYGTDPRASDE